MSKAQFEATRDLAALAKWLFDTEIPKSARWEKRLLEIADWIGALELPEPPTPAEVEYQSWIALLSVTPTPEESEALRKAWEDRHAR